MATSMRVESSQMGLVSFKKEVGELASSLSTLPLRESDEKTAICKLGSVCSPDVDLPAP